MVFNPLMLVIAAVGVFELYVWGNELFIALRRDVVYEKARGTGQRVAISRAREPVRFWRAVAFAAVMFAFFLWLTALGISFGLSA
jgi:hypothetical protein